MVFALPGRHATSIPARRWSTREEIFMARITEEGFTLLGREPGGHGGFSGYLLARVLAPVLPSDRCCCEGLEVGCTVSTDSAANAATSCCSVAALFGGII